ncbi:MAG: ATP-binding protein [Spirochaetales bacterium]
MGPMQEIHRIPPEELEFGITDEEIRRLDTEEVGKFTIIGQERAVKALGMGTEINAPGYNIYVSGMPGTGRKTTIRKILETYQSKTSRLKDIAFVYNFSNPESPRILYFPAGDAVQFRKDLQKAVENIEDSIRTKLESDSFRSQRERILSEREHEENRVITEFEKKLGSEGFTLVEMEDGEGRMNDVLPLYEGKPTDFDELARLLSKGEITEEYFNTLREKYHRFIDEMRILFQDLRKKRNQMEERLEQLRAEMVRRDVEAELDQLRSRFPDSRVHQYLQELQADILQNVTWFTEEEPRNPGERNPVSARYGVNILVDHSKADKPPVLFESHPDSVTLFGNQEPFFEGTGEPKVSYLTIRPGSLIRASGGFLVLWAEDLLNEEDAWITLKRALQDGYTTIRYQANPYLPQVVGLKPEPVQIETKVILIGNEQTYDFLYNTDEDFPKLFKVSAEFDSVMDRNDESTRQYMGFARKVCTEEHLLPMGISGLAAIVEYGAQVSEFRNKLTTRFSLIADLIREADYWARRNRMSSIDRPAVQAALEERRFLSNLPEEKIDEQFLTGEILISLDGRAIGKINGLAILDRGYYSFGRPVVITARTAPGHDGIINIERESGLSGEIHDKGVFILQGYLQTMYARDFPLSIRASICFEQSYIEVDGDSASSAEIYALLSAIADIPLRQDLAVTGSMNQIGEIQPVGGVSAKIEGFYEICRKTGLTGKQGVIIPKLNLPNVMISREVQKAVKEGMFHVYAVSTVEEGIEILTGIPAGVRGPRGTFPPGSVNGRVEKRLREMALLVKDFGAN